MIATSAIVRDVTARKATEHALATSEARLRTLIDMCRPSSTPNAAIRRAPDLRQPLRRGVPWLSPRSLPHRYVLWIQRVHPDDRDRVRDTAEQAHATGTPWSTYTGW